MNTSLYLFPEQSHNSFPLDSLYELLKSLEIVQALRCESKKYREYFAGDGFARHIIFMGCSPHLQFEPENDEDLDFSHIALHGVNEQIQLITGQFTTPPRCPYCNKRLEDWRERLNGGAQHCSKCEQSITAIEFDWRQQAAVGRCFIEFRNIFPSEASPSDELMKKLYDETKMQWQYAWSDRQNSR